MRILIVDDSLDKLSDIVACLTKLGRNIVVDTAVDIRNTYHFLTANKVDVLIVDLFLPERTSDGVLKKDGGEEIVSEICRYNGRLNVPKYIIGITQQEQITSSLLQDIWPIIHYRVNNKWSEKLARILNHIDYVLKEKDFVPALPTVFVEGVSDEQLLNRTLALFYPELTGKLLFKSSSNAGANWVAQQLIIWGHQLHVANGQYIVATGLLDLDEAGNIAKQMINQKITSSNQQKACKWIQLTAGYSPDLIKYFRQGLKLEIEIESLLPKSILQYADDQGWLEPRKPILMEPPKDWDQMSQTLNDFLISKGMDVKDFVYLKKVKMHKKDTLSKYVLKEFSENRSIFHNLKNIVDDLLSTLKLNH